MGQFQVPKKKTRFPEKSHPWTAHYLTDFLYQNFINFISVKENQNWTAAASYEITNIQITCLKKKEQDFHYLQPNFNEQLFAKLELTVFEKNCLEYDKVQYEKPI